MGEVEWWQTSSFCSAFKINHGWEKVKFQKSSVFETQGSIG